VLWSRPLDVTDCGGMGSLLITLYKQGVLVFCGNHGDGHLWHQFLGGEYGDRRVVALAGDDGHTLWQKAVGYRVRPLIVNDWLVAEPWAFDLATGEQIMREHPLTGERVPWQFERPGHHCGSVGANVNTLFFRSYSLGYYDLLGDYGTVHSSGQRPGCWINFIPAAGLLVMPEASSGCQCLFSIMCTSVFEPYEEGREWGLFSSPGPHTPVRNAHIDIGGPGDRRDDAGNLWLGYPRPSSRMQVPLDLKLSLAEGGGWFRNDADALTVPDSEVPWVYGTGAAGVTGITVPLLQPGDEPAAYSVRMHFCDTANAQPGARVFDIKLQGETVAQGFDIAREAGGSGRAVIKQFDGIAVRRALEIQFVPTTDAANPVTAPMINAIELQSSALPGMEAQVGTLDRPMQVYNLGYSFADLVRESTGADIALIPGALLWSDGDTYPAGPVTLGQIYARINDARLVRHTVSGEALAAYFAKPWVMDRFNPYHHPKGSLEGNPLYYSGLQVSYDAAGQRAVFDLDPARSYTVVTTHPFAGAMPDLPAEVADPKLLAIPGMGAQSSESLAQTTWDLLQAAADAGRLSLAARFPAPLPEWDTWRKQFEQAMAFGVTEWPADKPTQTLDAIADASVALASPDANAGGATALAHDGGNQAMLDSGYKMVYLRFPVQVPGRPLAVKLHLRMSTGGNSESQDAGDVYLAEDAWEEGSITYNNRPMPTEKVGAIGTVGNGTVEERLLQLDLRGRTEITLVLVPTSADGATFMARESDTPPQLIIAYEPQ